MWGGLGALSLGVLIGVPMLSRGDELTLTVLPVVPLANGASPRSRPDDGSPPLTGLVVAGAL